MTRIASRTTAALLVPLALVALVGCSKKKKDDTAGTTSSSAAAASSTAAAASSTAAASSAPADAASGSTVTIKDFEFTPATLNVKAGTTVTVTNSGSTTHTFTSVSGPAPFDTDRLDQAASAQVKFDKAGTYDYHCKIHSQMTGTVVVS
jgi:plastocyanin